MNYRCCFCLLIVYSLFSNSPTLNAAEPWETSPSGKYSAKTWRSQLASRKVETPLVASKPEEVKEVAPEEKKGNKEEFKSIALSGDDERLRPKDQYQFSIGPTLLKFTGQFSFESDLQVNRNLDSNKNNDEVEIAPELELNFILEFPNGVNLFTEVSFNEEANFEHEDNSEHALQAQLDEAFIQIPSFYHPRLTLNLGRQQFFEPRRWLYDESLDAVRFLWDKNSIDYEASLSTQLDFISQASYRLASKSSVVWNVVFRNQEPDENESPIWLAFQLNGRLKKKKSRLKYWFLVSYMADLTKKSAVSKEIRAFAVDLGGTYIFRKKSFKPAFTLGYAFGSGDSNQDEGVTHTFRQTGLHSNKRKFGGVTNFEYYGVVLDPELSNMHIITAGIGIRPVKKASVDIVYHYYRQRKASSQVRDFNIKAVPTGTSEQLGEEIDLILGYKGFKNIKLRFKTGYFIPGSAFFEKDIAFQRVFDVQFSF